MGYPASKKQNYHAGAIARRAKLVSQTQKRAQTRQSGLWRRSIGMDLPESSASSQNIWANNVKKSKGYEEIDSA
jgi:hypothetical protein